MQRRNFISLSATVITAIGVTGIGCRQNQSAYEALLDKPEVLSQICDLRSLKEIGTKFRQNGGVENQKEKLVEFILTDDSRTMPPSDPDIAYVQSLIRKNINRDFESGNTVVVEGWVLSVTEARQCALLSINNP